MSLERKANSGESGRPAPVLRIVGTVIGVGVALGIIVPLMLVTIQRLALAGARDRYPPPGRLVDVGEHWLHLYCDGRSEPDTATIVIDAGNASFSLDWAGIQRQLTSSYRVCAYDRAGYGWSQPGPLPRDAEQVVRELHALLQESGEAGPYLLVGHSLGGLHVQLYAARHPEEVAGLVLIDSATAGTLPAEFNEQRRATLGFYGTMRQLTASGLLRVLGPLGGKRAIPPSVRGLPEDVQDAYLALLLDPVYYETAAAEMMALPESVEQVSAALQDDPPFGDTPLIVLTAARSAPPGSHPYTEETVPADPNRVKAQGELAQLSTRAERWMLGQSGHLVHLDAPESVLDAVEAVSDVIQRGR
jgi:pimeloyl-ACP methyl ester carboxylesterase